MKASETKVDDFLSANKTQFVIPVYQRNYDWTTSQCNQLLKDILEVGSNKKMSAHFIGSIVYVHDDVYQATRLKELTIIDGQQRLTTITLIYMVLYRIATELKNVALVDEISETYLINKFAEDEEKLKLRLTENNDKALKCLLRGDEAEAFQGFSKLIDNFDLFRSLITQENYGIVQAGLQKLMMVDIGLDRAKDDPQRIFESLNSTGLELSQADLIRNFILMDLSRKEQNKIYQNYWEIIEKLAKDESTNASRVSQFIRDFLTLENKQIPNKEKVYLEFKAKYSKLDVNARENVLCSLKSLVKHYNKLLNPKNETDKAIRLQLEYINRLEVTVSYPFLMKVYEDYSNKIIDKSAFISILELIQSYSWRRSILGLPTNALNKIFMSLYDKVDVKNYISSIQESLVSRSGVQRFPRNSETVNALKEKDVYNIKSKNRTYLLERLENFENNEPVIIDGNPDITIEHIFPQNPDPKWKIELGETDFNFIKENYINTIGNLTLSGNNGKLGNKSFADKRDLESAGYKDSRLWLNKYLASLSAWNKVEIEKRFDVISERFLKIWDIPNVTNANSSASSEVNIFEAENPKFKKLEYAIFFDQRIDVREVARLYVEVFKKLFEVRPETFFLTDLGSRLRLTKTPVEGNPRQPVAINKTYFIEGNLDNPGKFELIKYALTLFDHEDELTIKYEEKVEVPTLDFKEFQ